MNLVPRHFRSWVAAAAVIFFVSGILPLNSHAAESADKVLRHAVFFSFKDTSSDAEIQKVCDALVGLKDRIDSVIDVKWGKTTEGCSATADGFTHCFLFSFADEAGRNKYLPHPAHAKEFVGLLVPHMKDVFVVDYWASPTDGPLDHPLRHMAFIKFNDNASQDGIDRVMQAFDALPTEIDLVKGYEWGINNSPESHDDGFTHCFMITFESEADLAKYTPHPTHQALAGLLPPVMEQLRVIDFVEK